LQAEIARASVEDAFLAFGGPADVYIDGEFVSSRHVPVLGLNESFLCPLGYVELLDTYSGLNRPPPQRRYFHPNHLSSCANHRNHSGTYESQVQPFQTQES
jgi:hypothetical protein